VNTRASLAAFAEWVQSKVKWTARCMACEDIRIDAETSRWELENLRRELVKAHIIIWSQRSEIAALRIAASVEVLDVVEATHEARNTIPASGRVSSGVHYSQRTLSQVGRCCA